MKDTAARRVIRIDPSLLEIGAGAPLRFRVRLPGEEPESEENRKLASSVKRFGVLQPPILSGETLPTPLVVDGHRRLAAARMAGPAKVEAVLLPAGSLTRKTILEIWLEGASQGEPLSNLEKIRLTRRAVEFLGEADLWLIRGLADTIGKRLSLTFLEKLWNLLDLDERTLESLHSGRVSAGDLLQLAELSEPDRSEAAGLLAVERLSRREQREAVKLMLQVGCRGKGAWKSFAASFRSGSRPLLASLRSECRPSLIRDMGRIEAIIKDMHLPQWAEIHPPENMEGGSYRLSVRIRDEAGLAAAMQKLDNALTSGKIVALLKILKGEE